MTKASSHINTLQYSLDMLDPSLLKLCHGNKAISISPEIIEYITATVLIEAAKKEYQLIFPMAQSQ